MGMGGAIHFLIIAVVTLPIAGIPFALLAYISIRRDRARVVPPVAVHLVESAP